ncbi:MAG: hypothetical protein M1838_004057 [Thelocarpon superellum]|nr:MAG: hypothetical protein M1838_004057 [Thelocarpon superellum]
MDAVKVTAMVDRHRPNLHPFEALYKDLHQHPELSSQEERTAQVVANFLRKFPAFTIHEHIGGHGVAAVLPNGEGRTVLLRAEMDALPVKEATDLPYASSMRMDDDHDGISKPVMHACGHDMHMACLLAAAETLHRARDDWHGTLVVLFQPNEERAGGARAMVDDGLYDTVPLPDVVLGQHIMPYKAGEIGTRSGLMASAADSFDVILYGRGGHASQPHRTVDPVLMAAQVVVRLQGIVAREVCPTEIAVVSVGSIQAGTTDNVIPDHAVLKVNVRSETPATRAKILSAMRRIVQAESAASDAPKEPLIRQTSAFPIMVNDDNVTKMVQDSFACHFGLRYSCDGPPLGGSEDFPVLASAAGVPHCYWTLGCIDPEQWAAAQRENRTIEDIPTNHSPRFAPVIQPTLHTGVDGFVVAALTFLTEGTD